MVERNEPADILKTIEQELDQDMHPLLKKILDNIKPIGLAVGGIVIAVAVYSGVNSWQQSRHDTAVSELGRIMVLGDQAARAEKLQAFSLSGPADLRPAAQLELARIYTEAGEHDKAIEAWKAVGQNADMRVVAGLGEARALMLKGDHAAAVGVLSGLKKDAGEEFAGAISSSLAFAAEKAGQTDLAIAEYEALKSRSGGDDTFLNFKINQLKAKAQG